MNAQTDIRLPSLVGGGHVAAIVPQTFEDTWRIAKAVYVGGLAPAALVDKKSGEDAISAVAVAIMSGAELGLKPMVALRSFTVINGKPALYGDGLINVVRMSGKVTYLRTGCEVRDGKMVGFCEAKRSDTGEDKRVEFSQDDATRAGLWQTEAIVTKWNKFKSQNEQKPNDSPWWRFPQRMLAWRAAGYCLRELFGDVLGGIRDEFEAREIIDADEMRDVSPPSPPRPPSPPSAQISTSDEEAETVDPAEIVTETGEQTAEFVADADFDAAAFFEEMETQMSGARDEATVEEVWTALDPEGQFDGDDVNLEIAHKIKLRRLAQLHPINAG